MKTNPARRTTSRTARTLFLLGLVFLAACQSAAPAVTDAPVPSPSWTSSPSPTTASTPLPTDTLAPNATPLPASLELDPVDWQNWPIISPVPENARQIYLLGQQLGNDPHAFSILGDCQSEPDVFMGLYESDPDAYAALAPELQETVDWFQGSFNRESPTVRSGATTAALLWALWHQNQYTCTSTETPLQCELRIHKPSFAIIQVGTHYEDRNDQYMRMILDQLIAAGVVPILATKADDRDLDSHVNDQYAALAVEYNIPFWNFWAAVSEFPDRGLYTKTEEPWMGEIYLTPEALELHRLTALQVLDAVWRAVMP